MSILINDMEMPESCAKCHYKAWSNYYQIYECCACQKNEPVLFDGKQTKSLNIMWSGKADNCPLGEVVHCKECKWYSDSQHIDHSKMCKLLGVYPAPDGYCYAGKRKEGFYER